ncbi:MAG: phenylalanine--tRNA ligase subunit beta [Gemmatimonadales bacterium]
MKLSRKWLEAFLRRPLDTQDTVRRLAMLGAPVDQIEPLHGDLAQVVVARVDEVRPHPNADRLRLCVVDDGSPTRLHVVCGASNVTAGELYPFARVGTTLPGGVTLERRKIRGEYSEGMLCSARELGLGQDHDGILTLDLDVAPGTPFLDAMPIRDDRFVIDVTPNRPDLLGHKGVARELAASLGIPFRLPEIPGSPLGDVPPAVRSDGAPVTLDGVRVALEDRVGCHRLMAAVVRGITVGPSPAWLVERVTAAGMRSINNVVDVTNYVLLELNQPMHAYDLAKLQGPTLWVRRARMAETVITLDDEARLLEPHMTVIADERGAIGLGGIMGAAHVEVSETTTDLVLECAWFEPRGIRRTRNELGLSTEASYRFERGVDLWGGPDALRRCLELILATAGGTMHQPPADIWPMASHPPRVFLRPARVTRVLGVELPLARIEQYLTAIGATALSKPEDARIAVDVPGWRPDLVEEIDLIEEVARMHGYDAFPGELRPYRLGTVPDASIEIASDRVRRGLAAMGLNEVQSLPFADRDGEWSVKLRNPLAANESYLRRRLIPGLVRQIEGNWANQVGAARLFEVGTVFISGGPGQSPTEERHLAAVITGARAPEHWSGTDHGEFDRWDLKAFFESGVALAHPDAAVQVESDSWVAVTPDGQVVGRASKLAADAPPWAAPLFGFEVSLDPALRFPVRYRPLPAFPAAERDLSLTVPSGVDAARLERVIGRAAGPLLEAIGVRDEYRGPKVAAGARGLTVRLTFRDAGRTLKDSEVDEAVGRVTAALERETGVQLRAS